MPISFTGFKNVSALKIVNPATPDDNYMYSLTMQLTDDPENKDLSNFRNEASKPITFNYVPLQDNRFVNIKLIKTQDTDEYICINDEPLKPETDTLNMFSVVAKLLKRVKEHSIEKFTANNDYLFSEIFDEMVVPNYNMREALGVNYSVIAKEIINPENIKAHAEDVFDGLENIMMDYLA